MIAIHRLNQSDDFSWQIMPQIIRRVGDFCLKYDTETLPHEAQNLIRAWFILGDQRLGLWSIVDDDIVLAHCWITPEPVGLDHWRYMLIRQAEVDGEVDLRDEARQVYNEVKAWCRSLGLSKIIALTHREPTGLMRRWGFSPYKTLMELKVE